MSQIEETIIEQEAEDTEDTVANAGETPEVTPDPVETPAEPESDEVVISFEGEPQPEEEETKPHPHG